MKLDYDHSIYPHLYKNNAAKLTFKQDEKKIQDKENSIAVSIFLQ